MATCKWGNINPVQDSDLSWFDARYEFDEMFLSPLMIPFLQGTIVERQQDLQKRHICHQSTRPSAY